ncbi:MAG TPA: transcriptional repressor LexA [Thermoanaerobaculia bacterium]|nr:transcriptional repressor LexA [Thermoanaerobaculia bacterium]
MAGPRAPLTERQKAILEYFAEFQRERGLPPTHREICERFGYSSYGTVHKHLKLLRRKGYIEGEANQKRGLRLAVEEAEPAAGALREVPFFGRIAAGRPIQAWPGDEQLAVPRHLLRGQGDHYVLQVVGDSMIDEGIHDGDLVVVQRRDIAQPGEMVVALVGSEATLKRLYPEGALVRLQPANPAMAPLRVPAPEVRVQGVVVGLMRRF